MFQKKYPAPKNGMTGYRVEFAAPVRELNNEDRDAAVQYLIDSHPDFDRGSTLLITEDDYEPFRQYLRMKALDKLLGSRWFVYHETVFNASSREEAAAKAQTRVDKVFERSDWEVSVVEFAYAGTFGK